MNLSLKRRISFSFIITNMIFLILFIVVYQFLSSLNKDIKDLAIRSDQLALSTDEIRVSILQILRIQRKIFSEKNVGEVVKQLGSQVNFFLRQLRASEHYYHGPEAKKVIAQMLSYGDSLKVVLSKSPFTSRDSAGVSSVSELVDKIFEAFSEFQETQYRQAENKNRKVKGMVREGKKNMMIVIMIAFLGNIFSALIIPRKIALPFKKIRDAIRELKDNNFDVSIYYDHNDEIGEIASEMNQMIHSLKLFEELRADRISLEKRKFEVLANIVKKPLLLASADSKIVYMNNRLYSLLELQSDDVIDKDLSETTVAKSIIENLKLAIQRRSKIENAEISIPAKMTEEEMAKRPSHDIACLSYSGHANIIPIRGKESSLDYYLMVLSRDVFQ